MEREVKPFSKPWKLVERAESIEVQDSASRTLQSTRRLRPADKKLGVVIQSLLKCCEKPKDWAS